MNTFALSGAGDTQLDNFLTTSPFYDSTNFNATDGEFTVPTTGRYSVKILVNYQSTAAISVDIGAPNPAFVLRRTTPASTDLITGIFPILNVNVALILELRAILGSGQVILVGDVELDAGDVIGLFYVADGLNINLNLSGSGDGPAVVWSMFSLD